MLLDFPAFIEDGAPATQAYFERYWRHVDAAEDLLIGIASRLGGVLVYEAPHGIGVTLLVCGFRTVDARAAFVRSIPIETVVEKTRCRIRTQAGGEVSAVGMWRLIEGV